MGLFITFEGIEGSGKTTQIGIAGDYLDKKKIPFIITEEPGGTGLGSELRRILLDKTSLNIAEKAELLLFAADRAQHIEEVILPAMKEGKVVLCDRFSDATIAYQGFGRGVDLDFIRTVNNFSSQSLKPDLTLLFDVPVETGLGRITSRISPTGKASLEDRFEREKAEFHRRIRDGYLSLLRDEPDRIRLIDGSREVDEVAKEVCHCVAELIEG
ncbi:MAG: dTMP kinase [Thermodesulfobacteriota bacterium]|nr:dTMP kinase [Thermodesulfobacteriota bacterium]